MENTHTFFATPNNIQADCFYAHHLLEDGTFEQLGFSENFIHITTIKSPEVQSDWFLQNERVISSDQYVQIISIINPSWYKLMNYSIALPYPSIELIFMLAPPLYIIIE